MSVGHEGMALCRKCSERSRGIIKTLLSPEPGTPRGEPFVGCVHFTILSGLQVLWVHWWVEVDPDAAYCEA